MAKLSVHLVTWNGEKYIPYLFDSLRKQIYKDWQLVILDNASSDKTLEKIKIEIKILSVQCRIIENQENKGFAGGHNQLFQKAVNSEQITSEYILLLNQDMYLEPDCLEKMIRFMNEHEDVAVISPRLMQWNFEKYKMINDECRIEDSKTDKIDSLGLKVFRNRRVIEKYTGKEWKRIKPKMMLSHRAKGEALEVFGVSGALPMLKVSALDAVKFSEGIFLDESYHSYKEDVDLAFRLQSAGYKAFVLLDAVAYHDRSAKGIEDKSDLDAARNKKKQSDFVKYHSYKNHLVTLYKNEYRQNFLLDFPWIVWYELKKFIWLLLFNRKVLKGLSEIWKQRKDLKIKRSKIKDLRKISWKELRVWWI